MQSTHRYALVFIVASALAGFGACSSDEPGDGSGSSGSGGSTSADCGKDTDCAGELICLSGRCVQPLGSGGSGGAPECETDGDCLEGEVCEQGTCIRPGNCTGDSDTAALEGTYMVPTADGGTLPAEPRDLSRQCGIECLFSFETEEEQRVCTHDCIVESMGLTSECADCLVGSVECGRDNCLNECVGGNDELCFECTCGKNLNDVNCITPYEVCSGIPSTTCEMFGSE